MSKGLEAFEDIKQLISTITFAGSKDKQWINEELSIIEKELKQAQKDKEMLNVFKNALTIEHHDYPMVELDHSEDAVSLFVKELTTIKQNELDKSMREELREWVLKNAFPEELKRLEELAQVLSIVTCENGELLKYKQALEIIKNKELNVFFIKRYTREEFNFQCLHKQQLTQEEYDLLKEVLL